MGKIIHSCLDVRGALKWPKGKLKGMFKHESGRSTTADESRDIFYSTNLPEAMKLSPLALATILTLNPGARGTRQQKNKRGGSVNMDDDEREFWDTQAGLLLGSFIRHDPALFYDGVFSGDLISSFDGWFSSLNEVQRENETLIPLSGGLLWSALATLKSIDEEGKKELNQSLKEFLKGVTKSEFIAKNKTR